MDETDFIDDCVYLIMNADEVDYREDGERVVLSVDRGTWEAVLREARDVYQTRP